MFINVKKTLLMIIFSISIYFVTKTSIEGFDNYQRFSIQKDMQTGAPAYFGTCPEVVKSVNLSLAADRYLSQHLSLDGNENLKFYKLNILGYINGSFSFAQNCNDIEAVGRLLYAVSNITLDLAVDKGMTYSEAVFMASSYLKQAQVLGYSKLHKAETIFLEGRIERNTYRMKHNTNI